MTSSFTINVDWSKNGEWDGPGEDVTSRVRGQVSVEYGRDQSTALAPTVAGRGTLTLDNRSGDYLSRNTASPIFGYIKPARPVLIRRTVGGSTYTLFRGHTDDTPLTPDLNNRTVAVSMLDMLADFRGVNINTELYGGIRTGDAIGYVLDAAGWTGPRDLDAGATYIRWWWADNKDALTALEELIRSEGPPALLTVGADGSIIFKDRHHRYLDDASLTSQQTWRSTTGHAAPTIHRDGFAYDEAWNKIVNTGTVSVDVRTPQLLQEVWASETTVTVAGLESRNIIATASDPFLAAVAPVETTDYELTSGAPTITLSRTSGQSTVITVTAGVDPVVISGLRLRAQLVSSAYTVQITASDAASIVDYGQRSFPGDLPWCNQYDAQAVLTTAVELRAQPLPVVTARFLVSDDMWQQQVLDADMSDRVTITIPELDLDADFHVENIRHEWQTEFDHAVTFGTEAAPVFPTPVFRFNTSGAGFGDGKFATLAVEPATIFLFDGDTGHRFGEGLFAV